MNDGRREETNRVARVLREKDGILLLLHEQPDGDSIGSTLALGWGLRRLGKRVTVAGVDHPLPATYAFLDPAGDVQPWERARGKYGAAVLVDCSDVGRVGAAGELLAGADLLINVDHHASNTFFGHLNLVWTEAAAAGEITFEILRALGIEPDLRIATGLYTAILTDSGSFRYENTRPETLRLAAFLVEAGADPAAIAEHIYESRSLAQVRLMALALATLQVSPGGRVAWMAVSREMMAEAGATEAETEGLVNYTRMITGVRLGLLFRATAGPVRVSFRSRPGVDVNELAGLFGGGGHPRAAGCRIEGKLDEVVARVLPAALAAAGEQDLGERSWTAS